MISELQPAKNVKNMLTFDDETLESPETQNEVALFTKGADVRHDGHGIWDFLCSNKFNRLI